MAPELHTRFNYWEFQDEAGMVEAHDEADLWHSQEQNADDKHWARAPYWSTDEAVALTFGKDPNQVNWASIEDYVGISRFAGYYSALRERMMQAQHDNELPQQIRPLEYIAWAKARNIDYPAELERAVLSNETDIAKLQLRYEQLEERIRGLQKEKQNLHYELDCQRTKSAPAEPKELSTKERASLLKIVIAMAVDGYGYDPHASRSPVPKQIAQAIEAKGMRLDEDTVRGYLREAVDDVLPPREKDR